MGHVVQILVLLAFLFRSLLYLDRPRLDDKPRARPRQPAPSRIIGEPFAVLFGSQVLPTPLALLLDQERARLGQNWFHLVMLGAAPVVGYGLVRLLSPERLKRQHLMMVLRTELLLAVVVGAEMLALTVGVPVLSTVGPGSVIAIVATAAYLGCQRVFDHGYWPTLLVRSGAEYAIVVALIGWWSLATEGNLIPDPHNSTWSVQLVALLWWAVVTTAVTMMVVGSWRLTSWLRNGPPACPAPPGVGNWPPEAGEVWYAVITHENDKHKERPILVWERTETHVRALKFTSVDQSAHPRNYLRLSLAEWEPVLVKESWLSLEVTPVPFADFLCMSGRCPQSTWHHLHVRNLVRTHRRDNRLAPGFALRHRFYSAMNKHAGPYDAPALTDSDRRPGTSRRVTGSGSRW